MQISVNSQALIFLYAVGGGTLMAFIYDLFRIRRKAVKAGNFLVHLEDITYWIIVSIVMLGTTFYSNEGELRGYIYLGAAIGVVLYLFLLSNIIMKSFLFILGLIGKLFKTIWFILAYPFKLLYNVLKIPCDFLIKQISKIIRKIRNAAKVGLTKVYFRKRLFFNLRKKI